eukprot:GHVS01087986.1.p1 GENE.GHVS01087986.1~~GHVS01087986.1.p1  ORF type:complete len:308 (-),score=48.25 GHVS01087986.1:271-1194(-)
MHIKTTWIFLLLLLRPNSTCFVISSSTNSSTANRSLAFVQVVPSPYIDFSSPRTFSFSSPRRQPSPPPPPTRLYSWFKPKYSIAGKRGGEITQMDVPKTKPPPKPRKPLPPGVQKPNELPQNLTPELARLLYPAHHHSDPYHMPHLVSLLESSKSKTSPFITIRRADGGLAEVPRPFHFHLHPLTPQKPPHYPQHDKHRIVWALARHCHLSPKKTLRVVDEVKGMSLSAALAFLEYSPRRPAEQIFKVLKSALANAKYKYGPDSIRPRIVNVIVNKGPYRKKPYYRSRGRVDWKKTPSTHIWAFLQV